MTNKEQEKYNNNFKAMYVVIVILFIIILILSYFLFRDTAEAPWDMSTKTHSQDTPNIKLPKNTWTQETPKYVESSDIKIKLISDARAEHTELKSFSEILQKNIPSLATSQYEFIDFSDEWVAKFLQENKITHLPAVIFSTNNFDTTKDPEDIKKWLTQLKSGEYSLAMPPIYNPFNRDEKWLLTLPKDKLDVIKKSSYIQWIKDANITVFEYTDLECPACQAFHKSWYINKLLEQKDINFTIKHFPLDFHKNAQTASVIAECVGKKLWSDSFFKFVWEVYDEKNTEKTKLIEKAKGYGIQETFINSCLTDETMITKVKQDMENGIQLFNINATPSLVIMNTKTWKYDFSTRVLDIDKKIIEKLK